jgi:outer membrane protein assembly factor BamB
MAFLLLCSVTVLPAQVRELWRSQLTNDFSRQDYYELNRAAVDGAGNTVVGGQLVNLGSATKAMFVSRFDANGTQSWKVVSEPLFQGTLSSLTTDPVGNVFAIYPFGPVEGNIRHALVKLSPDGKELWRIVLADLAYGPQTMALKADADGNVILSADSVRLQRPGTILTEWLVMKFGSRGNILWKTKLPGYGYILTEDQDASRNLVLSESGEIFVAGGYTGTTFPAPALRFTGFAAKLGAHGNLEWWSNDSKGAQAPWGYYSIMAGSKGTLCAVGAGGPNIFSKGGKVLHAGAHGGMVEGVSADGGFLLRNQSYLYAVKANGGKERWGIQPMHVVWRALADGNDGWLAVGGSYLYPDLIQFAGIDGEGHLEWQASLRENPFTKPFNESSDLGRPFVFRVTDGSIRVVGETPFDNRSTQPGITVMAFRVE